jgi:hypothetical protein
MRAGHRHDEARRAEPACDPVVLHHGLLDGVELARRRGDPFDGADGLSGELRQEQDAGVESVDPARVGHHHGAGAAVAFVAAFLRSGEAALLAQPVEERPRGRTFSPHSLSVEEKPDVHVNARRVTRVTQQGAVDAA